MLARDRRWEAIVVAAILLVAAALRLARLATLPPGLFQDEAVYGVNAETVLALGPRLYYGEREPLYMVLVALAMLILGPTPLALRVTSACVGLVVVAAGGAFARQLFGRTIGLVTAAGLAGSLWLVALSRVGFRAITFPAVECLGLALFWRASTTNRRRDYALAGVVLGLSLYTYLAARFLPVALVAFLAATALTYRSWLTKRLSGIVVAGGGAILVNLPLAAFAVRHPEILFGRAEQVALPGGSAYLPALVESAGRTLGMIFVHGDDTWRHNVGGAPVFDPVNAVLFAIGCAVALRRLRPESLLALALASIMLVPGMLSIDSPHYLRTEGAAVGLYALWSLGLVWLSERLAGLGRPPRPILASRPSTALERGHEEGPHPLASSPLQRRGGETAPSSWPPPQDGEGTRRWRVALLVAGAIGLSLTRTGWSYFVVAPGRPELAEAFNADLAAAGRFLAQSPLWRDHRADVYVTDRYEQDRASVAFFLYPLLAPDERVNWLDERIVGTFFPQDELIPLPVAPSLYLVSGDGRLVEKVLGPRVRRSADVPVEGDRRVRAIWAEPEAGDGSTALPSPEVAQFGTWLRLEAATVEAADADQGGNSAPVVVLRWRVLGRPSYQPSIYVHVEDAARHPVAQADQETHLPLAAWRVGQELVTFHRVRLPAGTPPGEYPVTVGIYDKATGKREAVTIAGRSVAAAPAPAILVATPVPGPVTPATRLDRLVLPGLRLVGAEALPREVDAGTRLAVTLVWQAVDAVRSDDGATLALVGPDGTTVGEWRGPIGGESYPTGKWPPGTIVRQTEDLPIAPTASGPVELRVAVWPRDARGGGVPTETIRLGEVTIRWSSHDFVPPRPQRSLEARFDDAGRLVGVDLPDRTYHPGEVVDLTLYWQATGPAKVDDTVFVHLLDPSNHLAGQRDEPPVHGARPTTGWVAGEFIADPHQLPIDPAAAPGRYQIEVGLYDPATGQRVGVGSSGDRVLIGTVEVTAR